MPPRPGDEAEDGPREASEAGEQVAPAVEEEDVQDGEDVMDVDGNGADDEDDNNEDDDEEEEEEEEADDEDDGEDGSDGGKEAAASAAGDDAGPSTDTAAASSQASTSKSRAKALQTFPNARLKRVMRLDSSVRSVNNEAVAVADKAVTMFIEFLAKQSQKSSARAKRKTIQYRDVALTVKEIEALDFLEDIVPMLS